MSGRTRADLLRAVARRHLGVAGSFDSIPRRAQNVAPLSYAQSRVWFVEQLKPDGPLFNVPLTLHLLGPLDVDALRRAIFEIVRRHEVLRTTFTMLDGAPSQQIHAAGGVELPVVIPDHGCDIDALIREESERPFDLEHGPLLRPMLIRVSNEDHYLLLTMHHIVSDGWSRGILRSELSTLYNAFAAGQESPLKDLPVQYSDYAIWQREWLDGDELQRQLNYWTNQLAGAPQLLEIPTDRPRQPFQTSNGASRDIEIPATILESLDALAKKEDATLFMVLLAAFEVLLQRYSGQDDIVVGTAIANRPRPELEGMIGFFLNTLPLRVDLSGELTFLDLLQRVKKTALDAYAHQDLPFEKLVEELAPERSLSHSPVFQALFTLQNAPGGSVQFEGLQIQKVRAENTVAKFDLSMIVARSRIGLNVTLAYNTDLFDSDRIDRMLGHYGTLLEAIVAVPRQLTSRLPLLTEPERIQVLVEWNATTVDYDLNRCVHEIIEEHAHRMPEALALVDKGAQLSYGELNRRANQIARHLRKQGVGPESLVGVHMDRSCEMVVALLGILKAGAAYVPLDPSYPPDRLRFMAEDCGAKVILVQDSGLTLISGAQQIAISSADVQTESTDVLDPIAEFGNLAYVIYTSGSTGQPKGVEICHTNLMNLISWHIRAYGIMSEDHTTQVARAAFDASVWEIWPTLAAGASLWIADEDTIGSPTELIRWLIRSNVSVTFLPTPLAEAVLAEDSANNLTVRTILTGGDRFHHGANPKWPFKLINNYGPTESTVVATAGQVAIDDAFPPIGRPIDNTLCYLLDKNLNPVPVGLPGELYIGGSSLARGYLNRPDLTAERFVPNPFAADRSADHSDDPLNDRPIENRKSKIENRLYRTGDLCRFRPDGSIEFLGRADHQVKIRGFRIELGEIEQALRQHEWIRDCVVIERDERLVAYVVGGDDAMPMAGLREHLRLKLPEHMVPATFVSLDSLPLSPNGKVDRKALPEPDTSIQRAEDQVEPRNPIEEGVAEIWREVLRAESVSIHDNFFDLGGHSLLATQAISRIRNTFSIDLPLRALFESPTIAGIAERISFSHKRGATAPPIEPADRAKPLPLSFAQQRLWFIHQLDPRSPAYNIPKAIRLKGSLDTDALRQAIEAVVARHESLRTTFTFSNGQPEQVINNSAASFELIDLTRAATQDREPQARAIVARESRRPFDLERGPLFRSSLIRLNEDDHILAFVLHHSIADGWSVGILFTEIREHYCAFRRTAPESAKADFTSMEAGNSIPPAPTAWQSTMIAPLPAPLPIQYPDYAAWQRTWLQGEALEQQLDYWRKHLAGAPSLLDLPADRQRPSIQTFNGARTHLWLGPEMSAGLASLGKRQGATMFMTLLAAFQSLLYRYSGQSDIVIGTPIASRTRKELEGLIGFFANTLAIRGNLAGNPSFEELLGRTREACLGAYAHQDIPFDRLVDELAPERTLSHSPVFQVMFTFQSFGSTVDTDWDGLKTESVGGDGVTAKNDVFLSITQSSRGLRLGLEYNTDTFDQDRMERMLGHYGALLESILRNPRQRISSFQLLTEPERRQLQSWNQTSAEYPDQLCLHELFEEQARRTPRADALLHADGALTYEELNARANQVAAYLRNQGVGAESLVALCMDRSIEMVVGVLGILKSGAAYVALDPAYPAERLRFTLQDSGAAFVVTRRSLLNAIPDTGARVICLDRDRSVIESQPRENLKAATHPDNLAYVLYTSGSTGVPKGVAIQHRSPVALVSWALGTLPPEELSAVVFATSLCFDLSVYELFVTLCGGGQLLIVDNALAIPQMPRQWMPTLINTVPSAIAELIRQDAVPDSVMTVNLAGEPLKPALVDEIYRSTKVSKVYDLYGPSEDTTYSTFILRVSGARESIGRPIANTQVYILDAAGQPAPVGIPGELCIGSLGLARGYLNRPDLTAERFVPNPFLSGDPELSTLNSQLSTRLYRTGDLARYLPDGNLEFLGRRDHQVKIRGFRIELGEIEQTLAQHAGIREAVVLAREDSPGEKRLAAYIVPKNGDLSAGELRDHLRGRLPDYMIPSAFVNLEAMPLSPNGKVDRKALPAIDQISREVDPADELPRTAAEECLAGIWRDVLRLDQVGINENFFELGGDSILSIQIISRANQAGLRLAPRQIFEHQTIAGLAAVAESRGAIEAEQGPIVGPADLTPIQRWFFEQDLVSHHHFNQARLLCLRTDITPEMAEQAVDALVQHHDALRLRFEFADRRISQWNAAEETNKVFSRIDLSSASPDSRAAALAACCAETQSSLNLVDGPLIRATYVQMRSFSDRGDNAPPRHAKRSEQSAFDAPRLLIVIHHLCVDGVSWRILLEDLRLGLEQAKAGEAVNLPAKTTSFQRWSSRLMDHADSDRIRQETAYWSRIINSGSLPVDHPGGVNSVSSQRTVRVSLDEDETRILLTEAPAAYHTQINDLLLTALAQALTNWMGTAGLIDMEGHGREDLFEDVDLTRTVGWFTSLYPVRLELPIGGGPGEAIKSIKEQLRTIPNRGIGYGILRYLVGALPSGDAPQISFNYHGQVDLPRNEGLVFEIAPEPVGPAHNPDQLRSHLIDIVGSIRDARLQMTWIYSEHLHNRATIERLAQNCFECLRALVAHCRAPESGGFTPSDFSDADIDQEELDNLLAAIAQ